MEGGTSTLSSHPFSPLPPEQVWECRDGLPSPVLSQLHRFVWSNSNHEEQSALWRKVGPELTVYTHLSFSSWISELTSGVHHKTLCVLGPSRCHVVFFFWVKVNRLMKDWMRTSFSASSNFSINNNNKGLMTYQVFSPVLNMRNFIPSPMSWHLLCPFFRGGNWLGLRVVRSPVYCDMGMTMMVIIAGADTVFTRSPILF